MALNQGKYKPTICAIDEVDDRSYKLHPSQNDERIDSHGSKQQIEGSETAPLTTNQQKLHMEEAGLTPKELEAARKEALSDANAMGGGVTPTANTPNSTHASANGLRGKTRTAAATELAVATVEIEKELRCISCCFHFLNLSIFTHIYVLAGIIRPCPWHL